MNAKQRVTIATVVLFLIFVPLAIMLAILSADWVSGIHLVQFIDGIVIG